MVRGVYLPGGGRLAGFCLYYVVGVRGRGGMEKVLLCGVRGEWRDEGGVGTRIMSVATSGLSVRTVQHNKSVLGRNNLITFPARAICNLKKSTLGPRTSVGVCTTGKEPSSGPLVIRVTRFSGLTPVMTRIPRGTGVLTRGC